MKSEIDFGRAPSAKIPRLAGFFLLLILAAAAAYIASIVYLPMQDANILVIATDSGRPAFGAQGIFMVFSDVKTGQWQIFYLPRDTFMEIPGYGENSLKAAYTMGGKELIRRSLENSLNVKFKYTVRIDLAGIARLIDKKGGVEMNLQEGVPGRKLSGVEAFRYIRESGETDIKLGKTQELIWVLGKTIAGEEPGKWPGYFSDIDKTVNSDLSLAYVVKLFLFIRKHPGASFNMQKLPIRLSNDGLRLDPGEAGKMLSKYLVSRP